jgi:hypothetical protein
MPSSAAKLHHSQKKVDKIKSQEDGKKEEEEPTKRAATVKINYDAHGEPIPTINDDIDRSVELETEAEEAANY